MGRKKKKKIGIVGVVVIIGALLLMVPVIIGMLSTPTSVGKKMSASEATSGFDAVGMLESSIPARMKGGMWPIGDWKQSRLDEKTWRVTGDDCVWKVSKAAILCAEDGIFVSVCSENGRARRYSGLPFCKSLSTCGQ